MQQTILINKDTAKSIMQMMVKANPGYREHNPKLLKPMSLLIKANPAIIHENIKAKRFLWVESESFLQSKKPSNSNAYKLIIEKYPKAQTTSNTPNN